MATVNFDASKLAPIALVLIAVIAGLGLWSTVNGIQADVSVLNAEVAQLEDLHTQVEDLHADVVDVTADVAEVARARDDILIEICAILERAPAQCGVTSP